MKRFAAHYLFVPEYGFLKQYVVEIRDAGYVSCIFPFTQEIESVEWYPGAILLAKEEEFEDILPQWEPMGGDIIGIEAFLKKNRLFPHLLYPFDFTSMQPVAGTRHRLLR